MTLAGTDTMSVPAVAVAGSGVRVVFGPPAEVICTVASELKAVPITHRVKPALPATTELGFKEVIWGGGPT